LFSAKLICLTFTPGLQRFPVCGIFETLRIPEPVRLFYAIRISLCPAPPPSVAGIDGSMADGRVNQCRRPVIDNVL
jgi:hypothetical protein